MCSTGGRIGLALVVMMFACSHVSVQQRACAKVQGVWRNIPIARLSFAEEAGGGEGPTFISGIRSGTLTFSDTGEKFALREKDHLFLDLASGIIQELELGSDALRISFEAQARKVSSGVTGFEANLAPTWLSYFYHQERLGLFWGFVGVLWGVLWSARQLLFK